MIPTNLSSPSPWAHNTKALLNELLPFFFFREKTQFWAKSVCARQFSVFASAWMPNTTAFKCFSGLEEVLFSWKKKLPNWTRYSIVQDSHSFSKTNRIEIRTRETAERMEELSLCRYSCGSLRSLIYLSSGRLLFLLHNQWWRGN